MYTVTVKNVTGAILPTVIGSIFPNQTRVVQVDSMAALDALQTLENEGKITFSAVKAADPYNELDDDTTIMYAHDEIFYFGAVEKPGAAAILGIYVATRPSTLQADLRGCKANEVVNATADAVFSVQVNAVEKGTITFKPDGTHVFTAAADVAIAIGDLISVVAPAQDATLSGVGIAIVCDLA